MERCVEWGMRCTTRRCDKEWRKAPLLRAGGGQQGQGASVLCRVFDRSRFFELALRSCLLSAFFVDRGLLALTASPFVRTCVWPLCSRSVTARISNFEQVVTHLWFKGFDWAGLHNRPGPLIPSGCANMEEMLEYLKFIDKSDARFPHLIDEVTRNFDKFPDAVERMTDDVDFPRVDKTALADPFIGYSYKRQRKPRMPLSGELFEQQERMKKGGQS